MRLFIAFPLSFESSQLIYEKIKQRKNVWKGSWVNPGNYHITIQFLGETNPEMVSVIDRNLKVAKEKAASICVQYLSVELFPDKNRPKALVVNLEKNEKMNELVKIVRQKMIEIEYKEDNSFHPHITLARFKIKQDYQLLAREPIHINKEESMTKFCLYESQLTREGAIYHEIKSYSLEEGN